jgi:hypothetical protein
MSKKARKQSEATDTEFTDEYIDPAEAVRRRVDNSISIGSPLLYPF